MYLIYQCLHMFVSNLPRSPHVGADSLCRWLWSLWERSIARSLGLYSGAKAGFEAQQSLLDLGESSGALGATVLTGRGDGRRHRPLDELVHPQTGVFIQVGFGEQGGDPLEASFVAFFVTVSRTFNGS